MTTVGRKSILEDLPLECRKRNHGSRPRIRVCGVESLPASVGPEDVRVGPVTLHVWGPVSVTLSRVVDRRNDSEGSGRPSKDNDMPKNNRSICSIETVIHQK